jgi:hypothetical protein
LQISADDRHRLASGYSEVLMLRKWVKLSLVSIAIGALGLPIAAGAWVALALIGF